MKLTQVVRVEGDYATLENLSKITNGLYNYALYLVNHIRRSGYYSAGNYSYKNNYCRNN